VPPGNTPLRVALIPAPGRDAHPYINLLTAAYTDLGVEFVQPKRVGPGLAGRNRPDLVHLHWVEYLVRAPGGRARTAARNASLHAGLLSWRARRVGIVWTVHNLRPHEEKNPWLENAAMHATARLAHRLIAHSEHARERVREVYGEGRKIEVIPIGDFSGPYPDPRRGRDELRAALGIDPRSFTFLVFGQVRRYKRVPETIEAFRALDRPDLSMLVAGSAPDPAEQAAVERAAAGDPRVVLRMGFVPDDEVAELHLATDAAVLGYRELFSSGALLLALSLGLPAVVPAHGSALEVAKPPALEPFEEGALSKALDAISRGDGESRRRASREAAKAADWRRISQRTVELYREVADEARRR
jgi:glycosyltransferase involved in cell wall biosynthesis